MDWETTRWQINLHELVLQFCIKEWDTAVKMSFIFILPHFHIIKIPQANSMIFHV